LGKNVSKEKLEKFIKITNFAEVLKKLPNGLETHIKEKGVNLSGGQKQRLALTRGLLAAEKSKIILLDEPTSSLDIENEIEIYKKIFKNFKDSCIISSVHKPYLLDLFDKKYHFTNGKIKSE
jgi:ABC-type bacteriocin/lantibiotic exporter with double-glycine peptidase domain